MLLGYVQVKAEDRDAGAAAPEPEPAPLPARSRLVDGVTIEGDGYDRVSMILGG